MQVMVHHWYQRLATGVTNNGGKFCHRYYWCCSYRWKRWPKKIIKTFLIEDFFHLPTVSGACGKLIHEKNLKSITSITSWHCPFNVHQPLPNKRAELGFYRRGSTIRVILVRETFSEYELRRTVYFFSSKLLNVLYTKLVNGHPAEA